MELSTPDQNAAKRFYAELFGWTVNDSQMGPDMVYTMFEIDGRNCAAACTMQENEKAMGAPPHWNLYINVENGDETTKRAVELGGKALMEPFDVETYGRMSVIQDPQGAVFCTWQAKDHHGSQIQHVPGTLCWVDLNTKDQAAGAKYYSDLFGWEVAPGMTGTDNYLHIKAGEEFIGGIPDSKECVEKNIHPHWLPYIHVVKCDESAEKVKQMGGAVHFGPLTLENVGRFAVVSDPQGAFFSVFEPAPRA